MMRGRTTAMDATLTRSSFDRGARALSTRSLRALADVLPALYAETALHELPRAFADALVKLIPGESYGVVVHDRGQKKRFWHLRPATAEHESLVPVFFGNFHEFAPADYRRLTGSGTALAVSDFTSRPGMDRLAIYTDYYRRLGIEDDLSINVQRGEVVTCAAVLRRRRGFRTEERELMNALRPHFKQAWANAQCFAQLSAVSATASTPASKWTPEPLELRFGLTPREAEVLVWVAQGKTNPEVAAILGIRPYTVRTHLEKIFAKLGVETRHAAGLRAMEVLGMPCN
jgi:DNA-binding CsgD family transcriptional regulator